MPPLPKDRHGGVAITWTVTQDGCKVRPGPPWQGSALQIISKSPAEKHCQFNSRGVGLDLCTCFIPRCWTRQEIQWARFEGQLHSCSKVCLCHSAGLGGQGEGTGSRAWDKGAPHPRTCFTSYMTALRQALCAGPGKVPELNTDRVISKLTRGKKKKKRM